MTFCERIIASCNSHSDKIAMRVVGGDGAVSYAETLRQIRSIAFRLQTENIAFGDRVALIGENHPNWAIAYLGTIYHGSVCVPLDPHGEIETITNFLENSEAKLAFISPDQTEKFQQIEEKLGRHIPAVVWQIDSQPRSEDTENVFNRDTRDERDLEQGHNAESPQASLFSRASILPTNGFQSFSDWTAADFPDSFAAEIPKAHGDDTALLIYTSGTTGTPKGVPLTHRNIVAELGEAMKQFKPTILTTVPRLWYLFHKKIFDAVAAKPKTVQALFKTLL
ncbi:MAG TPA: AMP-binding protein, partial [Pyrinomonadaceae bacterium]|nr:AMP-binding protein [Pyrinomonadaceae bacterium]